jgi:broad specificity phosphatase PhoE
MTELWLVRHGQTDWNLEGRWQGQASHAPGLSDIGRAQALSIREQSKGIGLSALYSSDLLRARQTAELIAEPLALTVRLEPRLREMNLGSWEGLRSEEIEVKYPQELTRRTRNPFYTSAPNGESPCDVAERVLTAIDDITKKHPGESVLVVSHGIALATVICHTLGFPPEDIYQYIPENAQPYRVQWSPARLIEIGNTYATSPLALAMQPV